MPPSRPRPTRSTELCTPSSLPSYGSRASLVGARQFKWIADSREITDVTVVAVVSPYAAVPFANELGHQPHADPTEISFTEEARVAVDIVAAKFDGWGPTIHKQLRSGSPARRSSGWPRTSTPT